jgi:glutamate racemase
MKKIVITDSGLGGLSVAASLYERLKNDHNGNSVDITFVNALPETGRGYNTMPDTSSKVDVFNKVLYSIDQHFNPQLIGIACNTLSILADQTEFSKHHKNKILGIINCGIDAFLKYIKEQNPFYTIIFGTETTIKMDIHRQRLIRAGLPSDSVIPQICAKLASAIEYDPHGDETKSIIYKSVREAARKIRKSDTHGYAYLACTHYGYVKSLFEKALNEEGFTNCEAFDPNQSMVKMIINLLNPASSEPKSDIANIQMNIIARCTILEEEINSISQLISKYSPDTAKKLINYSIIPDLF